MKKNRGRSELSSLEPGAGTVRERTLAHMAKLLRNASKLGVGIALACGVTSQACKKPIAVDPPPPPPPGTCENPDLLLRNRCIEANAQWEKSGGKWTIDLNIGFAWGVVGGSFEGRRQEDIHVSGASVLKVSSGWQKLGIVLTPVRGKTQIELECPMQFDKKQIPLRLKLDLSKPHKKDAWIPVELLE